MELQCKKQVEELETLRQSRVEGKEDDGKSSISHIHRWKPALPKNPNLEVSSSYTNPSISQGSVPSVIYPDLSAPSPPPLPPRSTNLLDSGFQTPVIERARSSPQITAPSLSLPYAPPKLPVPAKPVSRTPSPDKKGRMLTTLRGNKDSKKRSSKGSVGRKSSPATASWRAAGLAWDSVSSRPKVERSPSTQADELHSGNDPVSRYSSMAQYGQTDQDRGTNGIMLQPNASESDLAYLQDLASPFSYHSTPNDIVSQQNQRSIRNAKSQIIAGTPPLKLNTSSYQTKSKDLPSPRERAPLPGQPVPPNYPSYRNEYQPPSPSARAVALANAAKSGKRRDGMRPSVLGTRQQSPQRMPGPAPPSSIARRPGVNGSPRVGPQGRNESADVYSSESADDSFIGSHVKSPKTIRAQQTVFQKSNGNYSAAQPSSGQTDQDSSEASSVGDDRIRHVQKHLPRGVDENSAKQIFNEIVVQGDEVHWDDVAGLDIAKAALKEAVVYPFLRPDLFLGLREPARGMLLFGPPGTGKTMLARAVATESRSTFFAISSSSLTSKWLGESEKLVRALFALAKALAPSIIFFDEIDSLLSSRGGSSEHESSRRIKTEFLIQWSDLQRAAAGKVQTEKEKAEGDATRVLVLAATNMPWAIDEAARRRFVRRQYIPLPEDHVRGSQLRTLLGHQKHSLNEDDIQVLVALTDGLSTSLIVCSTRLTIHRLFRLRYHGLGQGRGPGSRPKPRRSYPFHPC